MFARADESVRIHSEAISRQVHASNSTVLAIRQQAAEERRQTYLAIFQEQAEHEHDYPKDWWKRPFVASADLLIAGLRADANQHHPSVLVDAADDDTTPGTEANSEEEAVAATAVIAPLPTTNRAVVSSTKLCVHHNEADKTFEFDAAEQAVVLVGRRAEADVLFTGNVDGSSRLHAILYLFPEIGKLLVVDVGSQTGITMLQRQHDKTNLVHSRPLDRRTLELQWGEACVLQMGSQTVTLAPPECIVCMSAPRSCRLACGHFVACDACTNQLHECPLCRKQIVAAQVQHRVYALETMPAAPRR